MRSGIIILMFVAAVTLMSCGSGKSVVSQRIAGTSAKANDPKSQSLTFLRKVSDNALYQKDLVSKMTFTINTDSKEISVPGSIHMRKDDVIRLQLFVPLLGTEVGRLEFTKDYVLIVDRIHKQYIKADYNEVDFLRDKGLTFYSLQALFWNTLFLPGTQKVGDDQLNKFSAELNASGNNIPVALKQGAMDFVWNADRTNGLINSVDITYTGKATGTSSLDWQYTDFKTFGSKKYPNTHRIHLATDAVKGKKKEVSVIFEMNGVSADSKWDARTEVSGKYKKVTAEEVLKKIISL